jgi:prepilin-type processing-associated H-X9-DG protein
MQYRLSTLLLAFVVVWSALAVFGMAGLIVAAVLLAIAAYVRSARSMGRALITVCLIILCLLFLVALLSPAVQTAREASRRAQCANNLRQIGLALLNYETASGRLPPAVETDKQGRPMHSWRVRILPYMEYGALYKAYGPNNSKLTDVYIPYFVCPTDSTVQVRPLTSYVAVTGPGTVWDSRKTSLDQWHVMLVEVADSGIHWAEPRDLTLDEACRAFGDGPGPWISYMVSGGFFYQDEKVGGGNVLFSDGHVEFIPVGLPPETLRGLFTGDEKAWQACEQFQAAILWRINWTNCAALAVLVISYGVMLFRPREKRPAEAEPAK